jgi:hypothetical protein
VIRLRTPNVPSITPANEPPSAARRSVLSRRHSDAHQRDPNDDGEQAEAAEHGRLAPDDLLSLQREPMRTRQRVGARIELVPLPCDLFPDPTPQVTPDTATDEGETEAKHQHPTRLALLGAVMPVLLLRLRRFRDERGDR